MLTMEYIITYYNETVKADIEALPLALRVRYMALTQRMATAACLNPYEGDQT